MKEAAGKGPLGILYAWAERAKHSNKINNKANNVTIIVTVTIVTTTTMIIY